MNRRDLIKLAIGAAAAAVVLPEVVKAQPEVVPSPSYTLNLWSRPTRTTIVVNREVYTATPDVIDIIQERLMKGLPFPQANSF